ncbi:MAG: cell division/cell wall cluster transcriptional repressor MraZ [Bifidobacteriaceae bacterium]|jgi:MraZ protein|nr:cell division/cell wall cluster transcriptional repressor MraZ [Bifidobacteriaceae bacterium]
MSEAYGEQFIKLDEKGRIILPSKARPAMADGVYLTRGQSQCIYLFSKPQFEAHRQYNREHAPAGMPAIAFDRIFYSSVVNQDMDKQGRITVPPAQRQNAGLERDLAVIGLEERIEIWDAAAWRAYLDQYTAQYAALVEGVR